LRLGYLEGETISEKCDWVAFTVPFYKDLTWPISIENTWKEIRPIRNYNKGQENIQGVRMYWHDTRPSQGKHVILSGSTLARLGDIEGVLNWIDGGMFHVSRIDLCVDIFESNLNPRNATYHMKQGQIKTHARSAPRWDDSLQDGYTQYVGKKTSETFLRIYDKASEMGTDKRWIRAKIVYQGDRATPALHAYLLNNNVRGMVLSFADFPKWKKWNKVMQAEKVRISVPPKETNTRVWLMESVSKSIAKEMTLEDSHEFWLNFVQRVREEYLQLTSEIEGVTF